MARLDGRILPKCYAMFEKGKMCMACKELNNEFKCTALTTTEYYWEDCPFYAPMCEHRVNGNFGFLKCKVLKKGYPCEGEQCPFYKEVNPF